MGEPSTPLAKAIRRALADPKAYCLRTMTGPLVYETIIEWQARAVEIAVGPFLAKAAEGVDRG